MDLKHVRFFKVERYFPIAKPRVLKNFTNHPIRGMIGVGVNKGKKHVSTCYFTLQNVHS
ncbi:hypothetical protein PEB0150_007110 [Bartonella apis]|nr:hypothetical protein PEB0150_007110 [Bartonella apis]